MTFIENCITKIYQSSKKPETTGKERIFFPGIMNPLSATKSTIMRIVLSSLSVIGCNDEGTTNPVSIADASVTTFDAKIGATNTTDIPPSQDIQNTQDNSDSTDLQPSQDIQDNKDSPDVADITENIDEVSTQDSPDTNVPDLQVFTEIQDDISATTDACIETEAKFINGANAINVLGQVDLATGAPIYNSGKVNNGEEKTNARGLNQPTGITIDTINHRKFLVDRGNNRVVGHQLNNFDEMIDYEADFVLGQPNLTTSTSATTKNSMSNPFGGIIYDAANNRLIVVDTFNNRVLFYDTATITNGEAAINVLGQTDFNTSEWVTTQNGMKGPYGLAYDSANNRLFVVDTSNNRVLVFDLNTIKDGQNAVNVLGQENFDTSAPATTQNGMNHPESATYDSKNNLLFVTDNYNHRVLVFNLATITNGQNAMNVLGQDSFNKAESATTQNGMKGPKGIAYDSKHNRLFVADGSNRILTFDTNTIANGQNAINVLGQADFQTSKQATTQNGLYLPWGLDYNPANDNLEVADFQNMRVVGFNTKKNICKSKK